MYIVGVCGVVCVHVCDMRQFPEDIWRKSGEHGGDLCVQVQCGILCVVIEE